MTDAGSPCDCASLLQQLPFAWGGPAGSARIRTEPEDFQVIEQGMVTPAGEGEHNWLYVRKRNSNTEWVARQLAKFAGTGIRDVSYAGMKDRHAVTEQWFSVHLPGQADPDWASLNNEEFELLEIHRHTRKLQRGTLKGNQFRLCLREVKADKALVEQRIQQIQLGGFPNYFGPQRFGHNGQNLEDARRWFGTPKKRIRRDQRSLYLSAVRSALFNRVLAARVDAGSWNSALAGEALQLQGKSACFVAAVLEDDIIRRVEALDVHPTGPLWGEGEVLAQADALAFETRQLEECDEWQAGLRQQRIKPARRALRVVAEHLRGTCEPDGSWILEFSLPAGTYATTLLRELFTIE